MERNENLILVRTLNVEEAENIEGGGILVGMTIAYLLGVGVGAGIRYLASTQK